MLWLQAHGEQAAPYPATREEGRKWLERLENLETVREDKRLLPDGAEGLTRCLFSLLLREQSHAENRAKRDRLPHTHSTGSLGQLAPSSRACSSRLLSSILGTDDAI